MVPDIYPKNCDQPLNPFEDLSEDRHFQGLAPPHPRLRVSVIIPARNEAGYLPAALEALVDQRDLRGQILDRQSYEVIILANNCSDSTADEARRFAQGAALDLAVHVVEREFSVERANVGTARRWLMDLACDRLESAGPQRGLIASTDADTRVASNWITASLLEVDGGADAVAGLIQVDSQELRRLGAEARRAYWLDRVHRRLIVELEAIIDPNPFDPYPRHDFHGGASLAITPRMYRQVGGLPPLPCWEDVALAEALWRGDARFVHSPHVRVRTSTRQVGRAPGGQSQAFTRWSMENATQWVEEVKRLEGDLVARRQLRQLFLAKPSQDSPRWVPDSGEVRELARAFQVGVEPLTQALIGLPTFGLGFEAVARLQAADERRSRERKLIPITDAITALRSRLREIKRCEPT